MIPSNPVARTRRRGLILTLGMIGLLGASLVASSRRAQQADGRLHVLCSFLPVYLFTLNVVGDTPGVNVDLLLSPDLGCPHDYSLRPGDLLRLNRADLIIANGLGAEPFLDTLLANKPPGRVITIADDTQVLEADHEDEEDVHAHGDARASGGQTAHARHHHEGRWNPHVWASPVQAAREVRTLGTRLALADPPRASRYLANAENYAKKLESLAGRMREAARGFESRNIITFHDAFAYLARDLDLKVAATLTVDPQMGTSPPQMARLVEVIDRQHVSAVFYEPAYSNRVAQALSAQTGVAAYPLNPFNYSDGRPDGGAYERVMEQNLKTLEQALGRQP